MRKNILYILLGLLAVAAACSTKATPEGSGLKAPASRGDVVVADYVVRTQEGLLVTATSMPGPTFEKDWVPGIDNDADQRPDAIHIGRGAAFEGLDDLLVGLAAGQQASKTLELESYGPHKPELVKNLTRVRKMPAKETISIPNFVARNRKYPKIGHTTRMDDYRLCDVVEIQGTDVRMECRPARTNFLVSYGKVTGSVRGDFLEFKLDPTIGSELEVKGEKAVVTGFDDEFFQADTNHPLAGKTVTIEAKVHSVLKNVPQSQAELPWLESYDDALNAAEDSGKPIFLVIHSHTCKDCKQYFNRNLGDKRILAFKDHFVWAQVEASSKNVPLRRQLGLDRYPFTAFVAKDGSLLSRHQGLGESSFKDLWPEIYEATLAPQK